MVSWTTVTLRCLIAACLDYCNSALLDSSVSCLYSNFIQQETFVAALRLCVQFVSFRSTANNNNNKKNNNTKIYNAHMYHETSPDCIDFSVTVQNLGME